MTNLTERTLVLFKPDATARELVGPILTRFAQKGLRLVGLKMLSVDRELAEKHYAVHKARPFFPSLVQFITSGPVVAVALEGQNAVEVVRLMTGATAGWKAAPGTIRGDFALSQQNNLVHASDGPETATRELALWFKPEELLPPGKGTGAPLFEAVYGSEERGG